LALLLAGASTLAACSALPRATLDAALADVDGSAQRDASTELTDGASGQDGATPPDEVAGCDGATLYRNPTDTALPGPWPVGARTVTVDGLTVEVWYPARRGSEAGVSKLRYDIRLQLPESQQATIPDADNPWQSCDCYRDLPLDDGHGPYPTIIFVHGTAAFRHQSVTQVVHWASRGFVVLAADHPGLELADSLAPLCPDSASGTRDLSRDITALIEAISAPSGELEFLAGNVDDQRRAVVGHSAGGNAAASAAAQPNVRVVIPMAANTAATAAAGLESILFLGGTGDGVVDYASTVQAYEGSPSPKRLVGLSNAGHLAFSDLCATVNSSGKNLLEVANDYGICGAFLAGFLFDCDPALLAPETGWQIINYASSAALESALQCSDAADNFASIESTYPDVAELRESL